VWFENQRIMKNNLSKIALVLVLSVISGIGFASKKDKANKVSITFKNNSLLPRHYTFVTYWNADRSNNATEGVLLMPYASKTIKDVVGTELFLADSEDVEVVMSGNPIKEKPFWVFKAEDEGKVVNLR
jgi:hypothetical protein